RAEPGHQRLDTGLAGEHDPGVRTRGQLVGGAIEILLRSRSQLDGWGQQDGRAPLLEEPSQVAALLPGTGHDDHLAEQTRLHRRAMAARMPAAPPASSARVASSAASCGPGAST